MHYNTRDVCFSFRGQKVKGQGHDWIKHADNGALSWVADTIPLSGKVLDEFSPMMHYGKEMTALNFDVRRWNVKVRME